jgi:fumarylacetoacetase
VVDLRAVSNAGCLQKLRDHALPETLTECLLHNDLNAVMALSCAERLKLRQAFAELFEQSCPILRDRRDLREQVVYAIDSVDYELPARIGDYTDFYASIYHATNVGSMFRPDNPLLPNYPWLPIAYHGRSSSIVVSGQSVRRPMGQSTPANDDVAPTYHASRMLDYELELGVWIAGENRLGSTVPLEQAEQRLFGVSLLNDWSARDIQRWEYQPLGPFLAKNFATSLSPWVITAEALAPFRVPAFRRGTGQPEPLPHLDGEFNRRYGGLDIELQVDLRSRTMREQGIPAVRLSQSNFSQMYWTVAQMITHHASNGCNLRAGDLLGSGTISGPQRQSRGCLLELTWDGEYGAPLPGTRRTALKLPTGEERLFLADGDEVRFSGYCVRDGLRRIGLGVCQATIESAS